VPKFGGSSLVPAVEQMPSRSLVAVTLGDRGITVGTITQWVARRGAKPDELPVEQPSKVRAGHQLEDLSLPKTSFGVA
jgi:hypothetical protein